MRTRRPNYNMDFGAEADGKPSRGRRFNLKLPKLRRSSKGNLNTPDFPQAPGALDPVTAPLSFEESLVRGRLSEACRQLVVREEEGLCGAGAPVGPLRSQDDEMDRLTEDRDALAAVIKRTLNTSLDSNSRNAELLRSAVDAICQEEVADERWAGRGPQRPAWRPSHWRKLHDNILRDLVEERMESSAPLLTQMDQSCLQRELCRLGKRLKEDLTRVVQEVRGCYPPEFDICKLYAVFYHQAFGAKVRSIIDSMPDENDSTCVLRWVKYHYRNILQSSELAHHINLKELGELVPVDMLQLLEEQYLTKIQTDVQTCIARVLEEAENLWQSGEEPENSDGFFYSPLAIDVIQFIDGAVHSTEMVLTDKAKLESIASLLKDFLLSFQRHLESVVKGSTANSKPVVMGHLLCVEHFREYLMKKPELFSEDIKESCSSVLTAMQSLGHTYLLKPIHKEMKPQYQTLGTKEWLKNPLLFQEVLDSLEGHIQGLRGLKASCHQEVMGQLRLDVTVEYVRRLLKGKVKLKNKDMQEQGSEAVSEDGERLHSLFTREGLKDDWLKDILAKIAEILRLQDLCAMQVEVAVMGIDYPDLSKTHVSALLKLKTNLSRSDRRKVKEALLDTGTGISHPAIRPFFSRVLLK